MRYTFIVALMLLAFTCAQSQETPFIYQKSKDANGNIILLGKCSRDALTEAPFTGWFQSNYDNYVVDTATCQFIKPLLMNKRITIFMGTWCGDSRREVPRVLKMLDCCGFPPSQLQIVMVGNSDSLYKRSPLHEEDGRNIVRVPTFIIEENGKEQGRIVEFPKLSMEKDLLSILRKEKYVPNYGGMRSE
jgi:hypothetical protein